MLQQAIQLDAGVTLNVFKGNENALGKYVASMERHAVGVALGPSPMGNPVPVKERISWSPAILLGSTRLMDRLPYRQALLRLWHKAWLTAARCQIKPWTRSPSATTPCWAQGGRACCFNDRVTPESAPGQPAEVGRDPLECRHPGRGAGKVPRSSQSLAEAQSVRYQQRSNAPRQMSKCFRKHR